MWNACFCFGSFLTLAEGKHIYRCCTRTLLGHGRHISAPIFNWELCSLAHYTRTDVQVMSELGAENIFTAGMKTAIIWAHVCMHVAWFSLQQTLKMFKSHCVHINGAWINKSFFGLQFFITLLLQSGPTFEYEISSHKIWIFCLPSVLPTVLRSLWHWLIG